LQKLKKKESHDVLKYLSENSHTMY